jgi:hypothetical protein
VPSCEDGVENGDETDADCGGLSCSPCAVGLGCRADEDCESGSCRGTSGSDADWACGATIVVQSAVYAANCSAATELHSVGETCDRQVVCDYTTNYGVDPGYDPNYGCPKDLTVTWSCGDDRPAQSVYVPGEAGTGAVVHLSCE